MEDKQALPAKKSKSPEKVSLGLAQDKCSI
jgi:hypothetical protein